MRSDNEQIELGNFKANYFDADTTVSNSDWTATCRVSATESTS
ncbi:hypothetical protein L798_04102 [Zootermopsis nevadensis]|uniref:Uncharacterized protein n=1 Tax=Zootermopsis nevadensis TaxID=136037 RepID=A0A067RBR2_ZOONE|nr:hypothetical protein L798_04102 [Zootermopsis nevadensis]